MNKSPTLIWFRNDLRLTDNSALAAAIELGSPIIPIFIWSPEEAGNWAPGAASKWFLKQSLKSLSVEFSKRGGGLVLRKGDSLETLYEIIEQTGANHVFWNRRYESPLREMDTAIKRVLRSNGIEVKSFNSSLLNEPHTVSTGSGKPYKVYTPYWRNVKDREIEPVAYPDFASIKFPKEFPLSLELDSLNLIPSQKWLQKFKPHWEVSEKAAQKHLQAFIEDRVEDYDKARDIPKEKGTSSLSPYLRWGLIGPRQVIHTLKSKHDMDASGPQIYCKEIYWREFAYNVLYHYPNTPDAPLQEKYADFPWQSNVRLLHSWQHGRTGYPIVDAGMRQLYQTGWMHNRVRMIVSSLLVKHLLQDWREGARWFWDTLVDADLASNTLGWQWSGGCGADAAPYFRIFNPITQGKKFDPEGEYVKHWVPELSNVNQKYIHEPWEASKHELESFGLNLGIDYPKPIIEHSFGRKRALEALATLKNS